ncbi:DUF1232 domain-containing protein [Mesorhizobium sp. M1A.F.Ca.ET.072.01.1.1]|uniref:YkvA family protein n=1 Tax=Mesorhizobium sp. M1A.F.Ca.ET.072.01.1.1 TaxID=2496753 RepID=UPI000FD368AD|nr:YkvA family protein [Mesorhizobium sp. M1A.F.Ca.ET.072.01.1.1]RUW55145.1 DUF1232 domain-containing protein [Mesorhizobium sp. M1A.F.Ca.ET.072.01.1.1]TIU95808.1 MAG: DUF1232 domain-containing protein [Mesorhizobium sp.]
MAMLDSARQWALRMKRDVVALWLAARDPRVPWYAKVVAGAVAAYALSPVDLVPDFIPIIGYLDDLVIVPLGILLAVKLVPAGLMREFRDTATRSTRPVSLTGLIFMIAVWIVAALALLWLFWPNPA